MYVLLTFTPLVFSVVSRGGPLINRKKASNQKSFYSLLLDCLTVHWGSFYTGFFYTIF